MAQTEEPQLCGRVGSQEALRYLSTKCTQVGMEATLLAAGSSETVVASPVKSWGLLSHLLWLWESCHTLLMVKYADPRTSHR